jgi:hypothetical protein
MSLSLQHRSETHAPTACQECVLSCAAIVCPQELWELVERTAAEGLPGFVVVMQHAAE